MNTLKKFFSRKGVFLALLLLALVTLALVSLSVGASSLPLGEVIRALFAKGGGAARSIVLYVRLPRTLAAVAAGAGLAVAGVLLQAVLQNPLASSGILGINAGSGLMAMVAAVALPAAYLTMPLFAFVGAVAAALFVYLLAAVTGAGKSTVVLAGVAVSSFLTAIVDALVTLFPSAGVDRLAFLIGGFSGVTLQSVAVCGPVVMACFALAAVMSHDLNVLSLGSETASSLGMRVRPMRFLYLMLAALLAGAAISLAGLIGFVGLIVPHLVRLVTGGDHRWLLPLSGVAGAILTLACDTIARTAFAPYELPVGILLSLLGAPFFLFLLLRQRRRKRVTVK